MSNNGDVHTTKNIPIVFFVTNGVKEEGCGRGGGGEGGAR
jgi:hypothetical protein